MDNFTVVAAISRTYNSEEIKIKPSALTLIPLKVSKNTCLLN